MAKYRKKPIVIDAVRWTGTNIDEVLAIVNFATLPNNEGYIKPGIGHVPLTGELSIPTLEGTMTAKPGDWIVRGVKGECYPIKPDIFEATYEQEPDHA